MKLVRWVMTGTAATYIASRGERLRSPARPCDPHPRLEARKKKKPSPAKLFSLARGTAPAAHGQRTVLRDPAGRVRSIHEAVRKKIKEKKKGRPLEQGREITG